MQKALIQSGLIVGTVGIAAWWILHNRGAAAAAPTDNSFMLPNATQTPNVPIFNPDYGGGSLLDTMPASALFAPIKAADSGGCGGNCSGCGCGAAAAQPYVAPQPYQIAPPVPVSIIPIQAIKKAVAAIYHPIAYLLPGTASTALGGANTGLIGYAGR